jgi:hypothetical protein
MGVGRAIYKAIVVTGSSFAGLATDLGQHLTYDSAINEVS